MSTVQTLYDGMGDRLSDQVTVANCYPYLNKAIRLISKRLFVLKSDIIVAELSVSFTASSSSASLPSDFWGLRGKPYINGYTYSLDPVPDKDEHIKWTGYGVPKFYEVRGQTLRLVPGTASAITIKGDYWQRPTALSATSDTVPFYEMFDDALGEYLVEATKLRPIPESGLQGIILQSVDEVVRMRDKTAPARFTVGVDWDM